MFHAPPRWRDFCSGLPAAFRSSGENWSPLAVAEYTWYQFHTGQVSVGSHPSFYFFFFLNVFFTFWLHSTEYGIVVPQPGIKAVPPALEGQVSTTALPGKSPSNSSVSISCSSDTQSCLFATPWTAARQASLSITNSRTLLKLTSIESVTSSNHLILCRPLLLLPSIFPHSRVFSNELAFCLRWPKYWSFGFSISPSNEYSGLMFFRMHWLDLLAVQGTLRSLLQCHNSKASVLRHSVFFIFQLPHP